MGGFVSDQTPQEEATDDGTLIIWADRFEAFFGRVNHKSPPHDFRDTTHRNMKQATAIIRRIEPLSGQYYPIAKHAPPTTTLTN